MFRLSADLSVYLHREPIDFRAGINSLAILVEQSMDFDPMATRGLRVLQLAAGYSANKDIENFGAPDRTRTCDLRLRRAAVDSNR